MYIQVHVHVVTCSASCWRAQTAGIGGAAHLVNFMGTDTVAALMTARRYYGCEMAGFSIPAAEHSTVTTWTKEGEKEAFRNMLTQFPDGIIGTTNC